MAFKFSRLVLSLVFVFDFHGFGNSFWVDKVAAFEQKERVEWKEKKKLEEELDPAELKFL